MRVLALGMVAMLGLWLSNQVQGALRTGTANVRNRRVRRRAQPGLYWTALIVQTGFALLCFIVVTVGLWR
jgi:ABC-type Fe3+ transport system permease subunit